MSVFEVILVRIFSHLGEKNSEYGQFLRSVRQIEQNDQKIFHVTKSNKILIRSNKERRIEYFENLEKF